MSTIVFQLSVCPSCVCEAANGESDLTETERAAHYATLESYDDLAGGRLEMVTDDLDPSFSHRRCDLCDGLAGDRYSVELYR